MNLNGSVAFQQPISLSVRRNGPLQALRSTTIRTLTPLFADPIARRRPNGASINMSYVSLPAPVEPVHSVLIRHSAKAPSLATIVIKGVKQSDNRAIHVATARALTPMRRPREQTPSFDDGSVLPSQRRTDLMAPKSKGFWSLLPYMAAYAVFFVLAWIARKRFIARQDRLVDEFGQVAVLYGTTPDTTREIVSEYKRKVGPGILRGAMFSSYLNYLISEKLLNPSTMQDVSVVKKLLKLSEDKAVKAVNKLGNSLKESPSLLGKLLFIAQRIISPDQLSKLQLIPLFPYSPPTVSDLQRNMLERCYKDYVNDEIDAHAIEEPPLKAASLLRIDPEDARSLFDSVVLARLRKKEQEAAEAAAAEAEQASKPTISELDYPARSGEPAKAAVHAYQCSDCGYTLFPAAGREFKFYGDDFVCPACGAPKDKFVDINS